MIMWHASVVVGYDGSRPGLCNAAINKYYDNYSCHREMAKSLNI